jgi:hypothetical protein
MNQPKYISIIKMSIVHAIAFVLLMQLTESVWMVKFMDCVEIMLQNFSSEEFFSPRLHPECIGEEKNDNFLYWQLYYTTHVFGTFLFFNIILIILSTIYIGHKWYWFILSVLTSIFLLRLFNFIEGTSNIIYRFLYTIFDNMPLAIYSNIIIVLSLSLFLYFGKPVIDFIKNDGKPVSDKGLDDILDA